ncbi:MAG: sulfotransferase family 2 domain-containing protein [Flavobacteriales bacterium]|nr:sulfotransferase family 2 domain-containing protein [Flavobacteriales bacterium]
MKVSHKHKYVFVELPQTASSAVGLELIENYNAENFMAKHALYREFAKRSSDKEKDYFVFSAVRDPMDVVVSKYMKYKNDHHNYSKKKKKYMNARLDKLISPIRERRRHKWIQKNNASFGDFFLKYYKRPYSNWSIVEHKDFDFIMRFEKIQDDFNTVLEKIGLRPVRPLPVRNKTEEKSKAHSYFNTIELQKHAKYVFGPYMRFWNYDFPEEWSSIKEPENAQKDFERINKLRSIFWKYFH